VRSRIETMRPVEIAEIKKLYGARPDLTLITREKTIPTLTDYTNAALNNKGDIERGRRIFNDQAGVACIKCHTVAGQGNAVGPDMTTIGAQFPRSALIEHILDPSKSVREGYQQVLIETSDDQSYAGLIKSESAESLTILTAQATLQTIPKSKITTRHNSALSLMPDGLHLGLSVNEFADLIAYLESLKTAQTSIAE
jgi:putative heme-binding domain-containing protein